MPPCCLQRWNKETMSQRKKITCRNREGKEKYSDLENPDAAQGCGFILQSWRPELQEKKFVVLIHSVVLCYINKKFNEMEYVKGKRIHRNL